MSKTRIISCLNESDAEYLQSACQLTTGVFPFITPPVPLYLRSYKVQGIPGSKDLKREQTRDVCCTRVSAHGEVDRIAKASPRTSSDFAGKREFRIGKFGVKDGLSTRKASTSRTISHMEKIANVSLEHRPHAAL